MKDSSKNSGLDAPLAQRIADALDRLAPAAIPAGLPKGGDAPIDAYVWEPSQGGLIAVAMVASMDLGLL